MLLYTPIPVEQVLEGIDKKRDYKEIDIDGVKLLVEPLGLDKAKIIRIVSSNPKDYLNPKISPGNILEFEAIF